MAGSSAGTQPTGAGQKPPSGTTGQAGSTTTSGQPIPPTGQATTPNIAGQVRPPTAGGQATPTIAAGEIKRAWASTVGQWIFFITIAAFLWLMLTFLVTSGQLGYVIQSYSNDPFQPNREAEAARLSHSLIITPIVNCCYADANKIKEVSNDKDILTRTFLYPFVGLEQKATVEPAQSVSVPAAAPPGWQTLALSNAQRKVISLSVLLTNARVEAAAQLSASKRSNLQMKTWVILLGFLTTVLVGWKSITTKATIFSYFIGGLAVIVSAASTAAASFDALYGATGAVIVNQRALGQLRRDHIDLVAMIATKSDAICDSQPKPELSDLLNKWSDRVVDSIAPRDAAAAAPQNATQAIKPEGGAGSSP